MRNGLAVLRLIMVSGMLISGGAGAAFYTGTVQIPDVTMGDIGSWGETTDDGVEIVTTVNVSNPNNFEIDLQPVSVAYRVYMNDVKMAHGSEQGPALPSGNSSVDITTILIQENIVDWWITHIRNDERTDVTAQAAVDVETSVFSKSIEDIDYTHEIETDILSMLDDALSNMKGTYTYSATGISLADPSIDVRGVSTAWGDIDQDRTELLLTLDVHNPNAYPLPTPEFVGQLHLNDVPLASWKANDVDVIQEPANGVIAPLTTEEIVLGVSLDHEHVDDWLTSHIKRGEYTEGELEARMAYHIEGERFFVPPQGRLHCDFRFWTGILEEQEQRMENDGCEFRDVGLFDSGSADSGDSADQNTDSDESDTDSGDGNDGSVIDGITGGMTG